MTEVTLIAHLDAVYILRLPFLGMHKLLESPTSRAIVIQDWTVTALAGVKNGELGAGDGGVKVGHAECVAEEPVGGIDKPFRTNPSSSLPMPKTAPTKPYDWTYTTTYGRGSEAAHAPGPNPVYYARVPLFEDELHDNGSSHLLVRVRVMPTCIFVLTAAYHTLRVDGVLPPLVVREVAGWEAPYDRGQAALPRGTTSRPLTDPTFIAKVLTGMPHCSASGCRVGVAWTGEEVEVAVLGGSKAGVGELSLS
ncbi:type 2A phosphatase activator TIP41, partial [Mycena rebaudengoi]